MDVGGGESRRQDREKRKSKKILRKREIKTIKKKEI